MSKLDPIDEFVREQLASGGFSDYEALVRYALANLKDRQSEIDELAEELRPGIESMQRGSVLAKAVRHSRTNNSRAQKVSRSAVFIDLASPRSLGVAIGA